MKFFYKHSTRAALPFLILTLCFLFAPVIPYTRAENSPQFRRLPIETYRQKMKAAWLGQMIGVAFTAPTEFRYLSTIMPEADVPKLHPGLINESYTEDNLYVEMAFLKTLETYGMDATSAQAGIDFANSQYQLWHANLAGRINLRAGIAPTDSGHPLFNKFTDDIDYQIEADFAGAIHILRRGDLRFDHPHGVEDEGHKQAVDDKPRAVLGAHGDAVDGIAEGHCRLDGRI